MIQVVLADDHVIVRRGIKQLLETHPDIVVVGEAADGEAVFDVIAAVDPDVLVLDLSLPKLSGMEVVRRLKEEDARVRTVVLSLYPEDQLALHLLRAGASAYLSKDRSPDELALAIRRVAVGGRYLTETLSQLLFETGADASVFPHERLSPREREVFAMLTDGQTVSEVSNKIGISRSTVSNHVASIREKLGVSSLGEIIRYAHRVGLLR